MSHASSHTQPSAKLAKKRKRQREREKSRKDWRARLRSEKLQVGAPLSVLLSCSVLRWSIVAPSSYVSARGLKEKRRTKEIFTHTHRGGGEGTKSPGRD